MNFKPGMRIYDLLYKQVGIIYKVEEKAIQVAFCENISSHGGILNYTRAYEEKHFIVGSRLMIVNDGGEIYSLEGFFNDSLF